MTRARLLAFIDCNILIAGMFVPMHPARAVMVLASNKHLNLITCQEVIEDIEDIEDEILERAKLQNDYELVDTCAKLIKATCHGQRTMAAVEPRKMSGSLKENIGTPLKRKISLKTRLD